MATARSHSTGKRFVIAEFITGSITTIAILIMAFVLNGDWLVVVVHLLKQFNMVPNEMVVNGDIRENMIGYHRLKDLQYFWISSMITGFSIYFIMGGFLHWYYYVRQRNDPESWKCQPTRWLPPNLEWDEIKLGCRSLLVTNTVSALLSCYIFNGGRSNIYYKFNQYGWTWWFLQWIFIFVIQDYGTYWVHRTFHLPYLYVRFHKMHHKYKQPTAFSATAIHPVEILCVQAVLMAPIFLFPVHWISIYAIMLYNYYFGILSHSGINFKHKWWQPWQPDTIFHDYHHQYVHVNFAFNCILWDKIHGTYKREDRIYNEETFYGNGKPISEASEEELKLDMELKSNLRTNIDEKVE